VFKKGGGFRERILSGVRNWGEALETGDLERGTEKREGKNRSAVLMKARLVPGSFGTVRPGNRRDENWQKRKRKK